MSAPDEQIIDQIVSLLNSINCKFVLVGGLAVGIRSVARFTKDIDFAVVVDSDQQAESIIFSLQAAGYSVSSLLERKQDGRISTVRLLTPGAKSSDPDFDLLFNATGIEKHIVESADLLPITSRSKVLVAALGHLVAMKILAHDEVRRPQDMIDIVNLLKISKDKDIKLAKEAVRRMDKLKMSSEKNCVDELKKVLKKLKIQAEFY